MCEMEGSQVFRVQCKVRQCNFTSNKISEKKMSTSVEVLCEGYPSECCGQKEGAQFSRGSPQHIQQCEWYRLAVVRSLD